MSLDKAIVAHIAKLARIAVSEQDLPTVARELSGILTWIEQLDKVDTSAVAPLTSVVEATLRLRDDVVTDGGQRDAVLANATAATQGFFVVPKVVE